MKSLGPMIYYNVFEDGTKLKKKPSQITTPHLPKIGHQKFET